MCTKTTGCPAARRDITCWRLVHSGVSHSCEEWQTTAPDSPANGALIARKGTQAGRLHAPLRHRRGPGWRTRRPGLGDLRNSYRRRLDPGPTPTSLRGSACADSWSCRQASSPGPRLRVCETRRARGAQSPSAHRGSSSGRSGRTLSGAARRRPRARRDRGAARRDHRGGPGRRRGEPRPRQYGERLQRPQREAHRGQGPRPLEPHGVELAAARHGVVAGRPGARRTVGSVRCGGAPPSPRSTVQPVPQRPALRADRSGLDQEGRVADHPLPRVGRAVPAGDGREEGRLPGRDDPRRPGLRRRRARRRCRIAHRGGARRGGGGGREGGGGRGGGQGGGDGCPGGGRGRTAASRASSVTSKYGVALAPSSRPATPTWPGRSTT